MNVALHIPLVYDTIRRGAGDHEGQGVGSLVLEGNQWHRDRGHPPPNFGLSENLLVINFSSKNANFEAEKLLFWGNLGSKLKF